MLKIVAIAVLVCKHLFQKLNSAMDFFLVRWTGQASVLWSFWLAKVLLCPIFWWIESRGVKSWLKQEGSDETTGSKGKSVGPDTEGWELPRHSDWIVTEDVGERRGFVCGWCMIWRGMRRYIRWGRCSWKLKTEIDRERDRERQRHWQL